MAGLAQTRRNLVLVLGILLAVDVAAAAFLFSPWGRSRGARELEYDEVRAHLQATMAEVRPLQSMDQKLERARSDTAAFYAQRLPAESSAVSAELGRLAKENSVQISQIKYDFKDAEIPGLRQVKIQAKLEGDYLKEVKFVNALERDPMFFILDGINLALPALVQAQQFQKRAARVGFDWPDIQGVLDKLQEELQEVHSASDGQDREGEIGDVLFVIANLARWYKVDAESALRQTNGKFQRRFSYIEAKARENSRELTSMTLEEMDVLWNEAKRLEHE